MTENAMPRIPAPFDTPEGVEYVKAVIKGINELNPDIVPYMTTTCTECDALGIKRPDDHCLFAGMVIIGCEGYWLINPAIVLDNYKREWYDWTKGIDQL